jgi:shikimate dehydrogenase
LTREASETAPRMPRHRPARLVLLGHPVAHSLSPVMQNAALRAAGIPVTYTAWDVAPSELIGAFRELGAEQGAGNVTTPHKRSALDLCSRLSPIARRVGAVNTFWVEDGEGESNGDREGKRGPALVGDNTDVGGFERAVMQLRGKAPADAVIGVLGAGGAAAAVLVAVADWPGCRARVWNRTPARAESLVARFPRTAVAAETPAAALDGASLVVNATTIGLVDGGEMPVDPMLLAPDTDVIDLVYRPGETPWVRAVRARGHRACDGLPMLLEQGALAFERWFGITPDRDAMRSAVQASSQRRAHGVASP